MTAGDRIASIAAAGVLAGAIVAVGALVLNSLSGIEARLGEMNVALIEGDESLRQAIREGDESVRQEVADLRRRVFHVSGSAEPPSRQGGS